MRARLEWPMRPLGGLASVKARIGWKGLQADEYRERGYIFLATPNIKGPRIDFRNVNYISEQRYVESPELMLQIGDVLLVKDGSTLGISNIVRRLLAPSTVNGSIAVLRCGERLVPAFLHQLTKATAFQKLIHDKKAGLGVPHLFQADLKQFEVPVPSPPEQRRIAEILDTLDEAIRKTEQVIAKLQQMKQGLLHDLLTRGIDHNGDLRDPERQPEKFKDSRLGLIPKAWEIHPAHEVCDAVIDCKNRTPPVTEAGHPVVRTPNVRDGCFVRDGLTYTDSSSYTVWTQRGRPEPGDVLITREAPVGEVCLLPDDMGNACLGQRMMMYRPTKSLLRNDFMLAALLSNRLRDVLLDVAGGSTVGHVRVGDVRRLPIPVPPLEEQEAIASNFLSVVARVHQEERERSKLRALKIGLLDDLLTGRVRVNVSEETIQ